MKLHNNRARRRAARRGLSLVIVAGATSVLSMLSLATLSISVSGAKQQAAARGEESARWAAEAGLAAAVADLRAGGDGTRGSADAPIELNSSGYYVERTTTADGLVRLVATGFRDRHAARVQLLLEQEQRSTWPYGVFADEYLQMDSNARVDSYDSALGHYGAQAANRGGGHTYALTNGDVSSNGRVDLDSNAWVYGAAAAGVGSVVSTRMNAGVLGATSSLSEPFELPTFETPALPWRGTLDVLGGVVVRVPAGEYEFRDIHAGKTATIVLTGPTKLVCDDFVLDSNSKVIVDASNGPVEIYVRDDFLMNSNTLVASTTYDPMDVAFYLESDNIVDPNVEVDLDLIDFDSNSRLFGTVLAPEAQVVLNSNFQLYGAMAARRVLLDSNSFIHYDERLGRESRVEVPGEFQRVAWGVLPAPRRVRDEQGWRTVELGTLGSATDPSGQDSERDGILPKLGL